MIVFVVCSLYCKMSREIIYR